MQSWARPEIATLPGSGIDPWIYDTQTGSLGQPDKQQVTGLYVCGITPYDATHIGHAATYIAYDVIQRLWRDNNRSVTYVQNVTDVDDPLLERATQTSVDWRELADEQIDLFRADMESLNVIPPDHYIGVVEAMELIVEQVTRLVDDGYAYRIPVDDANETGAADIYFSIDALADKRPWHLGEISGLPLADIAQLFAERGGDPDREGKRNPLDPLLWRGQRIGEPSWSGEKVGAGRPGWHIECTAIALEYLSVPFAVQGGGSDLITPHHELGASHALALTGKPMADIYSHTGMVAFEGEKISKSKGNLVLVSELRSQGVDPNAIRLAVLSHHYRSDWEWKPELLERAQSRLQLWRKAAATALASKSLNDSVNNPSHAEWEIVRNIRRSLSNDLDTAYALHLLDEWAKDAEEGDVGALPALAGGSLLGIDILP